MRRKMGNSSSQVAQPEPVTQDLPVTLQPSSQLPALAGTQDNEPQTLKRVAAKMDATVEDTVRKAKRERMKASPRGQRKSMPQHTRGCAIQPSQEVPDMREEVKADAGAEDEDVNMDVDEDIAVEKVAAAQATGRTTRAAKKVKKPKGKKRRLPWQEDDVESTADGADVDHGPLEDIDVNTLNDKAPGQKPTKRKRSDIELEKLQREVHDFAPDLESTPKPKPTNKRQKRVQDVEKQEVVAEQDEDMDEVQEAVTAVKPQTRGKAPKIQVEQKRNNDDHAVDAPEASSKRTKCAEGRSRSGSVGPASTTAANARTRSKQKLKPVERVQEEPFDVGKEDGVPHAEEGPADDDQLVDSNPTPTESPDDPAVPSDGDDDAEDTVVACQASASQEAPAPVEKLNKAKKSRKQKQADEDMGVAEAASAINGGETNKIESDEAVVDEAQSKSKKRRKGSAAAEDEADGENGDAEFVDKIVESDEDAPAEKKARKSKKSANKRKASSDDEEASKGLRGQIQGIWSKEERARADEIFDDVVRVTAIPAYELKANIIDWKNPTPHLGQLKDELWEAFPERSFKSIMRFCQRRYNAFERGKWTDEQDQLLREAFELWPDQWTVISDHVDRFWEDCRTRWRDVVSRPKAKAEAGPWSREEETRLRDVVQQCRETILKETADDEVRDEPERADALISWKVVSEKMDNTRAPKRCREKWKRIKHLDLTADIAPVVTQSTKKGKASGRLREIEEDYQACEAGDIYDMLTEICNAVPDVTKVFDHETTFWSVVAIRNPESKFKSSLRRRALQAAIEQYPCKAVWEARTLAAKTKGVKDRMEALHRKDQLELSRAYEGKPKEKAAKKVKAKGDHGEVGEKRKSAKKLAKDVDDADDDEVEDEGAGEAISKPKAKRVRKPAVPKRRDSRTYKSADLIVDSDDDDEEAAAGENDVKVARTPDQEAAASDDDKEPAASNDADNSDVNEEAEDGKVEAGKVFQQTDELSLASRSPDMSPSTFIERCRSSQEKNGGKGGKKRRSGMKG